MKSTLVSLRLNPDEVVMLDRIGDGETRRNRSEMLRLLIHREFNRRTTGKSVVKGMDVDSEHRNGRPKIEGV